MYLLQEALAGGSTSSAFKVEASGKVWIRLSGDFNSQTITMQESVTSATAGFGTFTSDATNQTFTASTYKLYDLPAGVWFRFSMGGSGGDVDIHIAGVSAIIVT